MKSISQTLFGVLCITALNTHCLVAQSPTQLPLQSASIASHATVSGTNRSAAEAFSAETLVYLEAKASSHYCKKHSQKQ